MFFFFISFKFLYICYGLVCVPYSLSMSLPVIFIFMHHTFHAFVSQIVFIGNICAYICVHSTAISILKNFLIFLKNLPFNRVCRLEYAHLLICTAQTDAQLRLQYNETIAQWITGKYTEASIGKLQSIGCAITGRIMYV